MKEIILPRLGEGVHEAKLIKWLKKKGDFVKKQEVVAEIATDKVDSDVISEEEGYVQELLYQEGEEMPVDGVIMRLSSELHAQTEHQTEHPTTAQPEVAPVHELPTPILPSLDASPLPPSPPLASPVSLPQTPQEGLSFISPLVAKMMVEHGISSQEFAQIKGSGIGGRVSKQDLQRYVQHRSSVPYPLPPQVPPPTKKAPSTTDPSKPETLPPPPPPPKTVDASSSLANGDILLPLDRVRLLIAKNLKQSQNQTVQVTSFAEADITSLVKWKKKWSPIAESTYGTKLTFTPLFIQAVAKALVLHPIMNATQVAEDKVMLHQSINIGLAVAQPNDNLIVPVIKNALGLNLVGMAQEINRLSEAAKTYTLSSAECKGGTFTVSNVGASGTLFGTPIINYPEVGILAIGAIKKRPSVMEHNGQDVVGVQYILSLSLSYDHRIVDGNRGGAFLKDIISNLENFDAHSKLL